MVSMKRGPDEGPRPCKYARIAEIGQRGAWPRPRYMKHPWRKGSVLEVLMHTCWLEGFTSASTCKSWTVKWMDGSKAQLTVNSPAQRNPKKPRQQATHSMMCSELWASKERWIIRMRSVVTGWRCGRDEPWWRLMPRRRRWSWRQFTKGSGKPVWPRDKPLLKSDVNDPLGGNKNASRFVHWLAVTNHWKWHSHLRYRNRWTDVVQNDTPIVLKGPDHWRDRIGTFGLDYKQLIQDPRRHWCCCRRRIRS